MNDEPDHIIRFLAHFLFILAGWTLCIKFVFPICIAWEAGAPLLSFVYWDFWWLIHILLGYSLLNWSWYTYWLGMLTAILEIAIIITKFVIFASAPQWNIWGTNWFINKVFVLICFCLLFIVFVRHRAKLRHRLARD